MANAISNMDDTIDSRDIIERIEELQGEREDLVSTLESASGEVSEDGIASDAEAEAREALDDFDNSEEGEELRALLALQEEAEGCIPDWTYGAQLIRDSYFEDYAQELAEDCGDFDNSARWPYNCIDWKKAARELQYDYTAVDFDGVTYWVR